MMANLKELHVNFTSKDLFDVVNSKLNHAIEDRNYYFTDNTKEWYYEWDFKKYDPNIYSHGFHQYPAKFIPQLARKILRVFTDENSVVLDNFCGSGTTLIECLLLNRKKAIGIELNPFACFMSKVKTTPIEPKQLLRSFFEIEFIYNSNRTEYKIDNFYNIDFWFKKSIIVELSKIKAIINTLENLIL